MTIVRDPNSSTGMSVDDSGRARTLSVCRSENEQATEEQRAYIISTGVLTLTTANESGVLYLKNGEDVELKIDEILISIGPSTGGASTDTNTINFYKNATAGTLISGATQATIQSNRNFTSSNTLSSSDAFEGDGTALTITDGSTHANELVQADTNVRFEINEVLGKGNTFSISIEPPTSNTSMKAVATILCHQEIING